MRVISSDSQPKRGCWFNKFQHPPKGNAGGDKSPKPGIEKRKFKMKVKSERVESGTKYTTTRGVYIGTLKGSVGAYGNSTGMFRRCVTVQPLNELGVTEIDGAPIEPWQ